MIFENFHGNKPDMDVAVQAAEIATGHALVKSSLGLEHLAASFVADASYFFDACRKWTSWPKLESLALISKGLQPLHQPASINDFLEIIAKAVMKMPRLKIMELWNGGAGFAGVFRYQTSESEYTARIVWRGTWDICLEPRVLIAWQAVVSKRMNCKLEVVTEILDPNVVIPSHGDAIRHLRLLNTVAHPVSLWQLLKETAR